MLSMFYRGIHRTIERFLILKKHVNRMLFSVIAEHAYCYPYTLMIFHV